MTAQEIYEKIIADLGRLHLDEYTYISGKNKLSNMRMDHQKKMIHVLRDGDERAIGFDKIETMAAVLAPLLPIDINDVFKSGGSDKQVLETLLSYLPNIGYSKLRMKLANGAIGGTKKLIWFDEEMHAIGTKFNATGIVVADLAEKKFFDKFQSGLVENSGGTKKNRGAPLNAICAHFCVEAKGTANILIEQPLSVRMGAALLAKRFLILTGLSGSGKTKIAQAFSRWLTAADSAGGHGANPYCALVPVGADWVGSENILGYPNGLDAATYMTRQALDLILHAQEHPDVPHFLILDEMNLSHVERYFADILSAIESGDEISLYEGAARQAGGRTIPNRVALPGNLFIIGTVNVDETTYMFSPKVLDRANVIEFRMAQHEIASFLAAPAAPDLDALQGEGAHFGEAFVAAARDKTSGLPESVKPLFAAEMLLLFGLLRDHHLEFGYRTAYETARFVRFFHLLGGYAADDAAWFDAAMDAVVIQKILPKLHGSRAKLEGLLWALAWFCGAQRDAGQDFAAQLVQAGKAEDDAQFGPDALWTTLAKNNAADPAAAATYPMSFAKVMRMWRRLVRDQFVTFTEA